MNIRDVTVLLVMSHGAHSLLQSLRCSIIEASPCLKTVTKPLKGYTQQPYHTSSYWLSRRRRRKETFVVGFVERKKEIFALRVQLIP
jgi:hypothetical protein